MPSTLYERTRFLVLGRNTASGPFLLLNGTEAAPGLAFLSEPSTGVFLASAGVIGFSTLGTQALNMYRSGTSGRLGHAGTQYLEMTLAGAISLVAAGTNQNITLTPSGTGYNVLNGRTNVQGTIAAGTYYFDIVGAAGAARHLFRAGINAVSNGCTFGYQNISTGMEYVFADGIVFINTSTNSSNGVLQLATHTSITGGIGFGTDVSLYRTSTNSLEIKGAGDTYINILSNNGVVAGYLQASATGTAVKIGSSSNHQLILTTNNVTALTLDTSQNALFVGDIQAGSARAIFWATKSIMRSPYDGEITFNNLAETGFTALNLGNSGAATSARFFRAYYTGIANAVATATMTITIPNAAHAARIRFNLIGVLGAGGAIGACEAGQAVIYDCIVVRTSGVNAVATLSTVDHAAAANVAGATTATITAALSAVSGAVGATNTFTLNVTISRAGGSSTNHTCHILAEILNQNATGITLS